MSHIFISYAHDDKDSAELLKLKLQEAGFDVWADAASLRAGNDWRIGIDDGIRGSAALIVVMTPAAKASEYVAYEWAFARGAGIKVIPILRKPTALHPLLESLQHFDFTEHQAWDKLIALLQEASESEPAAEPEHAVDFEDGRRRAIHQIMKEALEDINWTWRSIHTLAGKAGVSEEEAADILRQDDNVKLSLGKSGRRIAKLKSR